MGVYQGAGNGSKTVISHGSGETARERKFLDRRSRSEAKISGTAETARKRKFVGTVKLLEDESFWEQWNHLEATEPLKSKNLFRTDSDVI